MRIFKKKQKKNNGGSNFRCWAGGWRKQDCHVSAGTILTFILLANVLIASFSTHFDRHLSECERKLKTPERSPEVKLKSLKIH